MGQNERERARSYIQVESPCRALMRCCRMSPTSDWRGGVKVERKAAWIERVKGSMKTNKADREAEQGSSHFKGHVHYTCYCAKLLLSLLSLL